MSPCVAHNENSPQKVAVDFLVIPVNPGQFKLRDSFFRSCRARHLIPLVLIFTGRRDHVLYRSLHSYTGVPLLSACSELRPIRCVRSLDSRSFVKKRDFSLKPKFWQFWKYHGYFLILPGVNKSIGCFSLLLQKDIRTSISNVWDRPHKQIYNMVDLFYFVLYILGLSTEKMQKSNVRHLPMNVYHTLFFAFLHSFAFYYFISQYYYCYEVHNRQIPKVSRNSFVLAMPWETSVDINILYPLHNNEVTLGCIF